MNKGTGNKAGFGEDRNPPGEVSATLIYGKVRTDGFGSDWSWGCHLPWSWGRQRNEILECQFGDLLLTRPPALRLCWFSPMCWSLPWLVSATHGQLLMEAMEVRAYCPQLWCWILPGSYCPQSGRSCKGRWLVSWASGSPGSPLSQVISHNLYFSPLLAYLLCNVCVINTTSHKSQP